MNGRIRFLATSTYKYRDCRSIIMLQAPVPKFCLKTDESQDYLKNSKTFGEAEAASMLGITGQNSPEILVVKARSLRRVPFQLECICSKLASEMPVSYSSALTMTQHTPTSFVQSGFTTYNSDAIHSSELAEAFPSQKPRAAALMINLFRPALSTSKAQHYLRYKVYILHSEIEQKGIPCPLSSIVGSPS